MIEPRQVKTIADAKTIVEQRNLTHVKVGVFDIDGIMRGKYMSRAKFLSALESGYGFCDVVLGWDCQDQLYDNVQFTGWHTGYPDAPVRILPDSCRPLPFEDDNLLFLSEFAAAAEQVSTRGGALERTHECCRFRVASQVGDLVEAKVGAPTVALRKPAPYVVKQRAKCGPPFGKTTLERLAAHTGQSGHIPSKWTVPLASLSMTSSRTS